MDKLIDYMKYTTALAVGLLLYVPANFIPAHNGLEFVTLLVLMAAVVVAILTGILLYARATTIAVRNPPEEGKALPSDKWLKLWGSVHITAVLVSFVLVTPFFFYYKVWAPAAPLECNATFTDANGKPVSLSFPCGT